MNLEQQDKCISLGAQVTLVCADLFDIIDVILDKVHTRVLMYLMETHNRVSSNIKMSMMEVL